MALVPSKIELSISVISEYKKYSVVSYSHIATFEDGSVKILNSISKTLSSLLKPCEINTTTRLFKDNCTLYYKDWSRVRSYKNNFKEQYPKPILPDFIEDYAFRNMDI